VGQPDGRPAPQERDPVGIAEWRLITATHNLLKLWKHTNAPLAA
jgi:hypothetical protein